MKILKKLTAIMTGFVVMALIWTAVIDALLQEQAWREDRLCRQGYTCKF